MRSRAVTARLGHRRRPRDRCRERQVCEGLFTPDGYACARCADAGACIALEVQVYCAAGPCAMDQACGVEPANATRRRP